MNAQALAMGLLLLAVPANSADILQINLTAIGTVTSGSGYSPPPVGAPNHLRASISYAPGRLSAGATGRFDVDLANFWSASDDYSAGSPGPGTGGYVDLLAGVVTGFSLSGYTGDYQQLTVTEALFEGFFVDSRDEQLISYYGGEWSEWSFSIVTDAVPEPASWGMMIVGFGLIGATARRVRGSVSG